jgi:uncharacterized protein (TIGR00730 family)
MPPVKAYRNLDFLDGTHARTLRILAEYIEPESRLEREGIEDVVVFFGSARAPSLDEANKALAEAHRHAPPSKEIERLENQCLLARYYQDACELSRLLTLWARRGGQESFVLCSGGGPGIMEATNRGALEAGGRSIGLNISLPFEQEPNPYITEELNFEFHYFFMRKLWFVHLACAVVVFPGGFGTLDEFAEVLTLVQTGRAKPMPIVLYGSAFWDDVLDMEALARWGTISTADLELFHRADSPEEAFAYLQGELGGDEA